MKYLFLMAFLLTTITGYGQAPGNVKSNPGGIEGTRQIFKINSNEVKSLYLQVVNEPKEFVNGKEYVSYYYKSKTTPLIFSAGKFNAVLYMNGRIYKNVILQYDTYLDELVYTDTSMMVNFQFPKIALNKNLIQGFSFSKGSDSLKFKFLNFPDSSGNSLPDGFYEIAKSGNSSLVVRHRSNQYRDQAIYEYRYSPLMYISLGNGYNVVKKKKEFLLLFGEYSKKIDEYLKGLRIRINKAGKFEILGILKFYDSLTASDEKDF